jgi:15-cis-phytoene synthase
VSGKDALAEAYERCEEVTREQAANFFYGIRLLPSERRGPMSAVYAFARRIDDIGDGTLQPSDKLRLLAAESHALAAVATGRAPGPLAADPVMLGLADTYARFDLPEGALEELIEGVRMDVAETRYETFEELVVYCRRVAGAIGRVCLAIFARSDVEQPPQAELESLADDLGVALQLTNILRDLREDAENGRAYLPLEDLRRFGVISAGAEEEAPSVLAELAARQPPPNRDDTLGAPGPLAALVRFEAARADEWFARGMQLPALLDRRSAACVMAMAGIYRRVLARIEQDPDTAAGERVSLPRREKAWVAARVLLKGAA